MIKIKIICVINHCTYLIGIQTDLGTTACAKRLTERLFAKIQLTTVRITNLKISCRDLKFPIVWSDSNLYFLKSLKRLKQTVTRNRLMKEKPKVSNRRGLLEFGILQHLEKCRERRNRSTTRIIRKDSSLAQLTECKLSGSCDSQHLLKLKSDLTNGLKAKNLSLIMSDPNFLITCWIRIKSNKSSLTLTVDGFIDGIKKSWFTKTAGKIKNSSYKFQVTKRENIQKKPNNDKLHPLTISSPKDKIIQESMRFLLEIIFEPMFKNNSYGWKLNRGCLTVINDIQMKCKSCSWFIESGIEQQFPTLNHKKLIPIIKSKIDDQAFIDMLHKYMKAEYSRNLKQVTPMEIRFIQQGGILSPILTNIYMHPFDEWVETYLIPNFNKRSKLKINPKSLKKCYQNGHNKVKNKSIRSVLSIDSNCKKRMYYFRYADDFIVGVDGSKKDCIELKNKIHDFLQTELGMILNLDKTKITHAEKDSAKFLGYRIHKTLIKKIIIRKNKIGRLCQIVPISRMDAPIIDIVKRLIKNKYATKTGNPTRNGNLINNRLPDIINHYFTIERGILNYYSSANNYRNLAARVHFILKYSCVLTIASKMKLKTKKKVLKKYGKDLKIINKKGKIITYYPTIK
jgi:retron-type reverse transcriptase